MKKIALEGKYGKGKFALVSDEDYERLSKFRWLGRIDYGHRHLIYIRSNMVKTKYHYLHREVIGDKKGCVVDHINGDTLDNRRENLRHADYSLSSLNRRVFKTKSKSGIMGATRVGTKYQVMFKKKYLGVFSTAEEAHEVYMKARGQYYQQF